MNVTDWNQSAIRYSQIADSRRDTVFAFLRSEIRALRPKRLLDFGGGDGQFAIQCADVATSEVVTYDPAPAMSCLARTTCASNSKIQVVTSLAEVSSEPFEVVTFNAVWMCLTNKQECLQALRNIGTLLCHDGFFIAAVTHPCFRNHEFSTYSTDFDPANYLADGTQFNVHLFDGVRHLDIVDTHWSLTAMSSQLRESGFVIERMHELADRVSHRERSSAIPWLIIVARKEAHSLLNRQEKLAS